MKQQIANHLFKKKKHIANHIKVISNLTKTLKSKNSIIGFRVQSLVWAWFGLFLKLDNVKIESKGCTKTRDCHI